MKSIITLATLALLLLQVEGLHMINGDVHLYVTNFGLHMGITLKQGDSDPKITGFIGQGTEIDLPEDCDGASSCRSQNGNVSVSVDGVDGGFSISWTSSDAEAVLQDCLQLNASAMHWFGGPEVWQADWPVENAHYKDRPYTTLKSDNGAVAERYWLNSKGGYVFVDDKVPLYLDQDLDSICFKAALTGPYVGRAEVKLEYHLVVKENAKEAHLHAVNAYLGKPQEHPNAWIIRHPIWTTWARFYRNIDDEVIVNFAQNIVDHGFTGQIEIDDGWEECYGSFVFNENKFANIESSVQTIRSLGFTVTLWVHPFVNDDCQETRDYGELFGLFVTSRSGSNETSWWDGSSARYIDFSKEQARDWFSERLKLLQELYGINGFKFDSGESDYAPENPLLQDDIELSPNSLTSDYITTCANFGGLTEVRSAWRTQNLPIFLRMLDRDSRWGLNNGLQSLITTLLQLNMVGYVFILPDMIGGNGYSEKPTAELIARWTEANTFMPSMQFSYLPWEITSDDFDNEEIVRKFVILHEEYADEILAAMNNSIATGTPVNPPIWWVDPTNADALKVNDEYLLGETILVAPVVQQGAISRDVVLPTGSWKDGNDGTVYEGPQTLKNYSAPIDVLPFFIKQ